MAGNILQKMMNERGMKLATWAKTKGLDRNDIVILYDLNIGKIKGL